MKKHKHDWFVEKQIFNEAALLVKCRCGAEGVVGDPTEDELQSVFDDTENLVLIEDDKRVEPLCG